MNIHKSYLTHTFSAGKFSILYHLPLNIHSVIFGNNKIWSILNKTIICSWRLYRNLRLCVKTFILDIPFSSLRYVLFLWFAPECITDIMWIYDIYLYYWNEIYEKIKQEKMKFSLVTLHSNMPVGGILKWYILNDNLALL